MGIPDHLTCLLRNLYVGQEATVRTRHGTTDWFQIGKGVYQDCILSPSLFNFYAEYIMQTARLDEPQAGIKIAERNINNLTYADDTTLMAESEEELKSILMKVKEDSEKFNTQETKIMASGPFTSWQIDGKISISALLTISTLLTMPEPLIVWITVNCGKFLKRWEYRPPDLPLEKFVCRSGSNSYNWMWNNRLVPNQERSMSRLFIITPVI
uniref:Uncharacterized protein n=3 Tax=Ovis aries TaxID=9940 RepID=A0AC11DG82_SHEEP